jgi:2-polyprenyl-3-methyl-5-hydroxy-6-metoxy-1,4-benzoquinol methylase/DNA-directed RNA polymerase subunit RPC12/RpoP
MNRVNYTNCPLCNSKKIYKHSNVRDFSITGEIFDIYSCGECKFRFTQDHPEETDIGPYYESEDYISHSDTSKGFINTVYHWVRIIMLNKKYNLIKRETSGNKLLDIGCGTGYFPNYMKEKNYKVSGVEKEEAAREFAENNFNIPVTSPEYFLKDEAPDEYDIITLWHVLEHIENWNDYLNTIHKKLDKNGVLFIALPNHWSFDAGFYKEYWAGYDVPRHLWHFNPDTFSLLMKQHNFKVKKLKKLPFDSFYNALLSEKYRKNKLALPSGFIIGFLAFIKSLFNIRKASSVIYICEKT